MYKLFNPASLNKNVIKIFFIQDFNQHILTIKL